MSMLVDGMVYLSIRIAKQLAGLYSSVRSELNGDIWKVLLELRLFEMKCM